MLEAGSGAKVKGNMNWKRGSRMSVGKMFSAYLDKLIRRSTGFEETSLKVSRAIHQKVLDGGETTREAADMLHGKQLRHPLHPLLTDVTIGSWTLGTLFDVLSFITFSRTSRKAANRLIMLGTVTAIPTALTGLTDYSTIKKGAVSYGAVHGIMNAIAFFLFFRSVRARLGGNTLRASFYSFIGLGFATVSAWLGGDLVYRHKVGVNHAEDGGEFEDWTAVLAEDELAHGERKRVDYDGAPILVFREGQSVYAIGAVCSHAGGPLEEGTIDNLCVLCPWHDSVFDLTDGHVVHGPATFDVADYNARIHNGQIEVRRERLFENMDEVTVFEEPGYSLDGQTERAKAQTE